MDPPEVKKETMRQWNRKWLARADAMQIVIDGNPFYPQDDRKRGIVSILFSLAADIRTGWVGLYLTNSVKEGRSWMVGLLEGWVGWAVGWLGI